MKNINLLKKPEVFQGEKYLKRNKNYFEGYYFKNNMGDFNISFIPGIIINEDKREAFIQVITNNESWYIKYDINDFEFNNDPLWIRVGKNYFSLNRIHIDINDMNLKLFGDIKYSKVINIKKKILSPNIMGIFSYIPFMECNHAVLSMKNNVDGCLNFNDKEIIFKEGKGYVEKDYGYSFPKEYIWLEGNCFSNKDSSFMFSLANIPFKFFDFRGLICSLIVEGKEYRFATYNFTKVKKVDINDDKINIILKKGKYILEIECNSNNGLMLKAPINGKMERDIYESINSNIKITLKRKGKVIYSDESNNCGLEIVL